MDGERAAGDVRHLEHLAAVDAGRHEARGDVNHEPQAREAAPPLEPAADVGRQMEPLARDGVDRLTGLQDVGVVEPAHARHGPVVGVLGHLDRIGSVVEDPYLVAQMEVDRGRADLLGGERLDRQAPLGDLGQDHVTRQDHRRASVAEARGGIHDEGDAMRYEHILVSAAAGLATITMNRPERRNALSEAHMRELIAALGAASAEPDTRAIVLAANGPVFSAGHDFADMVERDLDGMRRLLATCTELMLTLQRLPQPVVARVHGLATAAGCQLVASCDLAVAAEEASFATPGGKGGSFCHTPMVAVARAVGGKRALELALTGDPVDARTALAWGLVNRVVPRARLAEETEALARAASRGSVASKALGKHTFYDTIDLDLEAAYTRACEAMATSAMTPDGREAMLSFLEKRPGVYPARR